MGLAVHSVEESEFTEVENGHLGAGGQSRVCLVRDNAGRLFAKKMFIDEGFAPDKFISEAQIVIKLNHPNIVKGFGIGIPAEQGHRSFIILEFMTRGSLEKLLHEGVLTSTGKAVVLAAVANGLEFLHARSLIHGDLKASNVLVSEPWAVKLSDFGMARIATDELVTQTAIGILF
jgi:serine/threonine-protein kinase